MGYHYAVIINPFVISRSALGVRCAGGRNWTQGDAVIWRIPFSGEVIQIAFVVECLEHLQRG
jgi:hypothetical protein